jgi:hypothetical protein
MQVITVDENEVPSMTSQEIYELVQRGGRVVLNYSNRIYSLASSTPDDAYFNYYDETYTMRCVDIANNQICKHDNYTPASQKNALPSVTPDDNGKLLQVVGGAWAAVSIINGNEVAY